MNLKKLLMVLFSIIIMWNIPILACSSNSSPQYTEKQIDIRNSTITFISRTEEHKIGYRCYPILDISIKENKVGVLQDGDVIYFETSKSDDKYVGASSLDIKSKGLTAEEVSSETENHFAIRISRTNKKELAQIDIRFEGGLSGGEYTEKEAPTFSLFLNADSTKEKNLFAGEQNILLNEQFLVLINPTLEVEKKEQRFKEVFPDMVFTPESNTMLWNEEQRQLNHNIYINQNGIAMIALDDFINIMENFNQIEDMEKIIIRPIENHDGYAIARGMYVCGIQLSNYSINTNGINRKDIIIEKDKNNVYYINLRGAAEILGAGDRVIWDNQSRTIKINLA